MKTKAKSKAKTKSKPKSEPAKVLVLRTCDANQCSRSGRFQWATIGETTTAPDWLPARECGNGLHGWLWGSGDWSLKEKGKDVLWLVIEVDAKKVVDLDGKVKFPSGKTLAVEKTWNAAMGFIRGYASLPQREQVATGDSGHASATGDYGHASATGNYGHASATGDYGHASATGDYGWAVAGYSGKVKAGKDGCVTIAYHDGKRMRVVLGYVGEDGIKADTVYCVENGKLKEVV